MEYAAAVEIAQWNGLKAHNTQKKNTAKELHEWER